MGSTIHEKFLGCSLGALVGDCFGFPFEQRKPPFEALLTEFLSQRMEKKVQAGLPYTDDTDMARSVAESLIKNNGFFADDMAYRLVEEYYGLPGPERSYSVFVTSVFKKLRATRFENVFQPATEQVGEPGSCGNGAAMRIYPVALFCYGKSQDTLVDVNGSEFHRLASMLHCLAIAPCENVVKMCRQASRLTHAHIDGYNGAILLSLALRLALEKDPTEALDTLDFLRRLQTVMEQLESTRPENAEFPSFCTQLVNVESGLKNKSENPSDIGRSLGTGETAVFSVPAAIYCFLRSQEPLPDYETENPFLRTLYLTISLGGDTDTIATMACAVSGAFHGLKVVPEIYIRHCEAWAEIIQKTERILRLVAK